MGKKSKRRGGQAQKPVGVRKGRTSPNEVRLPAMMSKFMSGGFTDPDINAQRWKFVDEVMSAACEPEDRSERDTFAALTKVGAVVQKVSVEARKVLLIEAECGIFQGSSLVVTCGQLRDCPFELLSDMECRFVTLGAWYKMVVSSRELPRHATAEYLTPIVDEEASLLMKTISSNEGEAMQLRSIAMIIRASTEGIFCNSFQGRLSVEASYRRRALIFASKVAHNNAFANFFLEANNISAARLRRIEGSSTTFAKTLSDPSEALVFAVSVGGAYCDCCMKSRNDGGLRRVFSKCKRCRLAHYCSKECQAKAWNDGHMHRCKEYGRFAKGDIVVVSKHAELLSPFMEVTGKSSNGMFSLRRLSSDADKTERLLVSAVNMRHVRPQA